MKTALTPNRIRELRVGLGLSMAKLGLRCLPPTTASEINKLEKGQVQLTERWLHRLGPALGCEPAEILNNSAKSSGDLLSEIERDLVRRYRLLDDIGRQFVWKALLDGARSGHPKNALPPPLLFRLNVSGNGSYELLDYHKERPEATKDDSTGESVASTA
jgi:transcriptional regulator with XRE-family HTH domain